MHRKHMSLKQTKNIRFPLIIFVYRSIYCFLCSHLGSIYNILGIPVILNLHEIVYRACLNDSQLGAR